MTKPDTKDPVQMEALYRVALHASQLFFDEDGEFTLAKAVETALRQEDYKNLPDHTSIEDYVKAIKRRLAGGKPETTHKTAKAITVERVVKQIKKSRKTENQISMNDIMMEQQEPKQEEVASKAKSFDEMSVSELCELSRSMKVSIEINVEPNGYGGENKKIQIEPWQPFVSACPYRDTWIKESV